jgi:serine/threonine-protein kinase SRPK3
MGGEIAILIEEYFDEEGLLKTNESEKVVGLEKRFEGMDVRERGKFVVFIEKMLRIEPVDPPSAKELLEEEWLEA